MLRLVPFQLRLLAMGSGVVPAPGRNSEDFERAARSGRKILQSALDYCLWRAGDGWRRLGSRAGRESADRSYYLDGARLISYILTSPAEERTGIQLTLPALNPTPKPDAQEAAYAAQPRAYLVSALMRIDSNLTDRKLLSSLPRPKLARMLREREKLARHTARRKTA